MCQLPFLHPTKARVSCLEDVLSRRRRELPAIQIWWPTQRHADVDWGTARLNPKLRHCKLDAYYIKSLRSMDFLHSLTLSRVNVEWFCKKCKYSKSSGEAIVTSNLLRYIHNFPTWSWLANYSLIETWTVSSRYRKPERNLNGFITVSLRHHGIVSLPDLPARRVISWEPRTVLKRDRSGFVLVSYDKITRNTVP